MKPRYLLDLSTLAELSRPRGNRRVFTLFQQRQAACALGAPTLYALVRGIEELPDGARRQQLRAFAAELVRCGPPVLAFTAEAALWLAQQTSRPAHEREAWSPLDGRVAAIAASQQLILVTRNANRFAHARELMLEDWFRP